MKSNDQQHLQEAYASVHKEPEYNGDVKSDITHKDREAALKITAKQAYEWCKTGKWTCKTFEIWLDHVISNAEYEAKYS